MEYLDRYDVLKKVEVNVQEYFKEHLPNYTVEEVSRHSNHPEDHYLYHVIAKNQNNEYACWTSWNETTQSLNFGHYGLESLEAAQAVSDEYYYNAIPAKKKLGR